MENLKNLIPYKDRYPTATIDVEKFEVIDIEESSDISFLKRRFKEIVINDNVRFVIENSLTGLIQKGKFCFYYSRTDYPHDRYVQLMMVEKLEKF